MTQETGPIYGVPLIDTLPLGKGMMTQQMASRQDLVFVRQYNERVVAAYEVALAHLADAREDVELLKGKVAALESLCHPKAIDGSGS
jgi:hypothetical protein